MNIRVPFFVALLFLLSGVAVSAGPLGWDNNQQDAFTTALARDNQGQIWVGTEDKGVWRYNAAAPENQRWKQFTTRDGLGDDNGYALAVDKRGRVWVGHLNHGVSVYNGQSWRNYDVTNGPLGERVFDMAVSPNDGDVWIATNAGLSRYSVDLDSWQYYTRADGLPSDQIQSLAFDGNGDLYAGTQCDGLAFGSSMSNFRSWSVTKGPQTMPNTPAGAGLPSNLINDVLVARDNTVYVATPCGLARSNDGGQNWSYLRGADWKAKVEGLYHKTQAQDVEGVTVGNVNQSLLLEDYVTSLAQDANGLLWIGYREKGYEVREPVNNKRLYSASEEKGAADYATAWLPLANGPVLLTSYGQGLQTPASDKFKSAIVAIPNGAKVLPIVAPFPTVAAPPKVETLKTMLAKVQGLSEPLPEGGGAYLGEDWMTQGDWVGRYGRRYAILCAVVAPADHKIITDLYYDVNGDIGLHHNTGDELRTWIETPQTDNLKVLYNPLLGFRREAEWDDHGEEYARTYEGPNIWVDVRVPEGVHRISLYFYNKDGHIGQNRFRDYELTLFRNSELKTAATPQEDQTFDARLKTYRTMFEKSIETARDSAPLARARVHDFWGPVYKQFMVRGPGHFYVKVDKGNSLNTILQSVMVDSLSGGGPTRSDLSQILKENGMQNLDVPQARVPAFNVYRLADMGDVTYNPPAINSLQLVQTLPDVEAARQLWLALDNAVGRESPVINSEAFQSIGRMLAYRAVAATNPTGNSVTAVLLANWKWRLKLWSAEDRQQFEEVMAQAYQSKQQFSGHRERGDIPFSQTGQDGRVSTTWLQPNQLGQP